MKKAKKLLNLLSTRRIKTQRFIYEVVQKIKGKLVLLHGRLSSIDEETLHKPVIQNVYQLFFDWLTDILLYGLILNIIVTFFINHFYWTGIVVFGLLRWLVFDSIKSFRETIK